MLANTTMFNAPSATSRSSDAFELPGGSPGVLLVHGFTGDPREMRPLADQLNKLGLYCYAPLLPGHGLPPQALAGLTDEHWLDAAREGLNHVRQRHEKVIVCSFSMGAALSAIMLSEDHNQVAAFVAIAPLIATRFPLLPGTPLVSRVLPWIYPLKFMPLDMLGIRRKILDYDPTLDLDDPEVMARLRNEVRIPVAVAEELRKIAKRATNAAHHIYIPTLVVQGERDLTLDPEGARRFFKAIAAPDKTLLTIPRADHDFVKAHCRGNEQLLVGVQGWVRQRFAGV